MTEIGSKFKTCNLCHAKLRGCIKLPEGVFCNNCFNKVNAKRNAKSEAKKYEAEMKARALLRPSEVLRNPLINYPDLDNMENRTKQMLDEKPKKYRVRPSERPV